MAKWSATWLVVVVASLLGGCTVDLGTCDETVLGGVPGMGPHDGQVIMNNSCAAGLCHSSTATAEARVGAPAELDFDVLAFSRTPEEAAKVVGAQANVRENLEEIWGEIDSGTMPPEGQRDALTSAQKETVRNWLACGAPSLPDPVATDNTADWTAIYSALQPQCMGCHSTQTGPGIGEGFIFGDDACAAYRAVANVAAVTSQCGPTGALLVVPNDSESSLLYQKLRGSGAGGAQLCGSPMPLPTPGLMDQTTLQNLATWIDAGAAPPPGCM